jgi:hypothetical protein
MYLDLPAVQRPDSQSQSQNQFPDRQSQSQSQNQLHLKRAIYVSSKHVTTKECENK